MEELMIKIENLTKQYKLGQIGGTTLRDELQRLNAKLRHKEDPTKRIGAKDYNKGETFMALDGVSFEVKKGERVGIIGHNGAGKSTLLKLLSRVTAPTSGEIGLNGRVASMLEVGTGFHGELTGRENIYMNGAILGMTKKEIDAKIEDIIEFSECRQFIDTPVKRYSSGMYVKLAFSVAAHLDSEIMIMDEVLAVGDMAFQKKCLDKMNDVSRNEGRTILYVSHNMNTIRQLCDRVIVLDHGKTVFDGDVESGITAYMGVLESEYPTFHSFTNNKRAYHFGKEIFIHSFEILEKDSAAFKTGETIHVKITFDSFIDVENAKIIIRIRDITNTIMIAGILSESFSVKKEKNQSICLSFKPEGLVEDSYCASLEIIGVSQTGVYHSYDNPYAQIPFHIENDGITDIIWAKQYWGSIRLPNSFQKKDNSLQ